jgi:hypothetical protein
MISFLGFPSWPPLWRVVRLAISFQSSVRIVKLSVGNAWITPAVYVYPLIVEDFSSHGGKPREADSVLEVFRNGLLVSP